MNWSFWQVWAWCLLAFLLGALIVYLIVRLRGRQEPATVDSSDDGPPPDETPTGEIPVLTEADLEPPASPEPAVPAGQEPAAPEHEPAAPKREPAAPEPVVAEPAWTPGPYPGSARPLADGSPPAEEFTIKGNEGSMLYHSADSPYFSRTKAQVWFASTDDAEAAGFTGWNKRRAKAATPS